MSAEKTPEWLVDLLYAGEEEEAGASPPEFDLSEDEHRSLAHSRMILSGAREVLTRQAPGEAVRASILEQARKAAAAGVAEVAAAEVASASGRRAASPREPGTSLWSRSRTSSVAQIVVVALALIASTAVLSRLQNSPARHEQVAPTMVAQRDTAELEAPHAAAEQLKQEAPATAAPAMGDGIALNADAPALPAEPMPDPSIVELEPAEGGLAGYAGDREARKEEQKPSVAARAPAKMKASMDYLAMEERTKDETARPGADLDDQVESRPAKPATIIAKADEPMPRDEDKVQPMRAVEKEEPTRRQFNSPESKVAGPPPSEELAVADKKLAEDYAKPADSSGRGRASTSDAPMKESAPSAPMANAPKAVAKPAAEPAEQATSATPASVRAEFNRADYRSTVTSADQYLGSGLGTPDQRAEMLDLKAQALHELGRTVEADKALRELEQKYPGYYSKNNIAKRKKAPTKASKTRMYNFDSEAAPSSSDSGL
jgi:hypothetical protein